MDETLKVHLALKQKLSNDIDTESSEYENLCKQVEALIGRGLAKRKKTPLDKFDALETHGSLKPGSYDILRDIFRDSANAGFIDHIDEADAKIREIQARRDMPTGATGSGEVLYSREQPGHQRPADRVPVQASEPGGFNAVHKHDPDETSLKSTYRPSSSSTMDYSDPGGNDYYPVGQHQKGYLLILNSTENRSGTEYDVEALVNFFRGELGFEVDEPRSLEQEDFTKEELDAHLLEVREKLNQRAAAKKFYCFICVILSHGDQKGVRTKGGELKSVEEIRKQFNNRHIPNFTGKPKLFFVQACRGLVAQKGSDYDDEEDDVSANMDEDDVIVTVPVDADTLIGYSTTPGYKSFRRVQGPVKGSWYIQELVCVFRSTRDSSHVEEMLVKVRGNVATNWSTSTGGKQMPCVWTTLTKKLKLK